MSTDEEVAVREVFYYEAVWSTERQVTVWRGKHRTKYTPTLSSLCRLARIVRNVIPFVGGWLAVM